MPVNFQIIRCKFNFQKKRRKEMGNTIERTGLKPLERWTMVVGFLLSGIIIGVVAVSYVLYSPFPIKILVWVIGVAFVGVALLAIEWPRAFRSLPGEVPTGGLRTFLILAIPIVFVLDSQICGLGLKACTVVCHVLTYSLIGLATVTAIQLYRGKSVGPFLVPMVVLSLIPHCVCQAPINTIWHSIFGGYAPTCYVIPLAATLFSISALRGVRTRWSAALVVVLLAVTVFIVVGNPLLGFPWQGCVG
jgi:hypothetical protein